MQTSELREEVSQEVINGERRQNFKQKVQLEVMKELGLFNVKEFVKAKTDSERDVATNAIFLNWVETGNNVVFRECFEDIVPVGTERSESDLHLVAAAVIAEMNLRPKKPKTVLPN